MSGFELVQQDLNLPDYTLPPEILFVQIQLEPEGLQQPESHEIYNLFVGPGVLQAPDDLVDLGVAQPVQVPGQPINQHVKDTQASVTLPSVPVRNKESKQYIGDAHSNITQGIENTPPNATLLNLGFANALSPVVLDELPPTVPCDFHQILAPPNEAPSHTASSSSWDTCENIILNIDHVYNDYLQTGITQKLQEFTTIYEENRGTIKETKQTNTAAKIESEQTNVKKNKINGERQKIRKKKSSTKLQLNVPQVKFTQKIPLDIKDKKLSDIVKNKILMKNSEQKHICEICSKNFSRYGSLKEHMITHRSKKPFVCNICNKEFIRKDHLNRHSKIHKVNECVSEYDDLSKIIPAASEEWSSVGQDLHKYIEILKGPDGLLESVDLEQHSAASERENKGFSQEEKLHVCDICKKAFNNKTSLARHSVSHKRNKYICECELCKVSPVTSEECSSVKQNLYQVHQIQKKIFGRRDTPRKSVDLADDSNVAQASERTYILENNNNKENSEKDRPFVCHVCNKGFVRKSDLSRHSKTHRRNKYDCSCKFCKLKSFTPKKRNSLKQNLYQVNQIQKKIFRRHGDLKQSADLAQSTGVARVKKQTHVQENFKKETIREERPFPCGICNRKFTRKSDLVRHSNVKHNKYGYSTQQSDIARADGQTYVQGNSNNKETNQEQRPFVCDICNKGFQRKAHLNRHSKLHKRKKYDCDCEFCKTETSEDVQQDLAHDSVVAQAIKKTHVQENNNNKENKQGERPFVCDICNKGYQRKEHLTRHSKIHKRNENVCECNFCKVMSVTLEECDSLEQKLARGHRTQNGTLPGPDWLQQSTVLPLDSGIAQSGNPKGVHENNNNKDTSEEQENVCEICNKKLTSKRYLTEHRLIHTGKPYVCHICNKCYITRAHLIRHLEIHRPNRCKAKRMFPKKHICTFCNKQFRRQYSFKEHLLIHSSNKPYVCDICNACYIRKDSLNRHLKTHKYNRYKCDICKKAYRTDRLLKNHMIRHTSILYTCDICNKNFIHKRNLIHHIQNHTEKNLYVCEICKTCYNKKYSLKLHLMMHNNEMQISFKCDICNKSYKQKQHLSHHLQFVHSKEIPVNSPFLCAICNKICEDKELEQHFLTHSTEEQLESSYYVPSDTLQTYVQEWPPLG